MFIINLEPLRNNEQSSGSFLLNELIRTLSLQHRSAIVGNLKCIAKGV